MSDAATVTLVSAQPQGPTSSNSGLTTVLVIVGIGALLYFGTGWLADKVVEKVPVLKLMSDLSKLPKDVLERFKASKIQMMVQPGPEGSVDAETDARKILGNQAVDDLKAAAQSVSKPLYFFYKPGEAPVAEKPSPELAPITEKPLAPPIAKKRKAKRTSVVEAIEKG